MSDQHTNETRELDLDAIEARATAATAEPFSEATWAADVTALASSVLALVAEVRRLRDPDVMLAALVDAGRLYTTTTQEGDASSVVTTLEYHGFRIIDQRGAGVSS